MIATRGKTSEQLLEEFAAKDSHNTLESDQYTAAITVKVSSEVRSAANTLKLAVDSLNTSINDSVNEARLTISSSTNEIKKTLESFNGTVEDIGDSSSNLSRKLLWLNIVLTLATLIGALAAIVQVYKQFKPQDTDSKTIYIVLSYPREI